jgi:hypothetical protein
MKKYSFMFFCSLFSILYSLSANAFIDKDTATIRVMNKRAGKVQTVSIPVGISTEYEKLSITVRTCKQTDPFDAEDFWTFIEISKNADGMIFSGWMSRNEPGDNPLQNADYDVWLVSCE